jgi:uncharacterized heparinase superfamily protein
MRLYADTCLRLPKVQLLQRVLHSLWEPPVPALSSASMRSLQLLVSPITRARVMADDGTFTFLNQSGRCDSPSGWQDRTYGLLWTYNLHYFADLLSESAPARTRQHLQLMERWRAENPAAEGVGWMPYPLSLRISNWIKWHYWVGPLPDALVRSLAQQAAWLYQRCEYHHRGNHLFVNAKALCMSGMTMDTPDAQRWLARGVSILRAEVPAQILGDGGHCERSPMYHALILEDNLDLLNITLRSDTQEAREMVELLTPTVTPMLRWLSTMCHPDGEIAFFNDAAFGIAPTPSQLQDYARRVSGSGAIAAPKRESAHLANSGFVRMNHGNWALIMDVGAVGAPEQPAHAHADSLSIEVSYGRQRLFVNSGVSTYAAGLDRAYERGTAAHNCVEVDGIDSSEVWSSFRVARRARVTVEACELSAACGRVCARHDGYARLHGRPIVCREIRLTNNDLAIADSSSGGGHIAISRLHLHPDVRAQVSTGATGLILLHLPNGQRLALRHNSARADIVPGFWRPEFGRKVPNAHLSFEVPPEGLAIRVCAADSSIHGQ